MSESTLLPTLAGGTLAAWLTLEDERMVHHFEFRVRETASGHFTPRGHCAAVGIITLLCLVRPPKMGPGGRRGLTPSMDDSSCTTWHPGTLGRVRSPAS